MVVSDAACYFSPWLRPSSPPRVPETHPPHSCYMLSSSFLVIGWLFTWPFLQISPSECHLEEWRVETHCFKLKSKKKKNVKREKEIFHHPELDPISHSVTTLPGAGTFLRSCPYFFWLWQRGAGRERGGKSSNALDRFGWIDVIAH